MSTVEFTHWWSGFGEHEQRLMQPLPEEGASLHHAAQWLFDHGDVYQRARPWALAWIDAMRQNPPSPLSLLGLLNTFPLDKPQGLALMRLAEAFLRIKHPDTASHFLRDKLNAGAFAKAMQTQQADDATTGQSRSSRWLTRILAWAQTQQSQPNHWLSRLSDRAIHRAVWLGIHRMSQQFILAEDIAAAISLAQQQQHDLGSQAFSIGPSSSERIRPEKLIDAHSFDLLGEGARCQSMADRYLAAYDEALTLMTEKLSPWPADSMRCDQALPFHRPSLSVKLSALHPRFEDLQRHRVLTDLVPVLLRRCERAAEAGVAITIDAEESERLVLTIEVFLSLLHEIHQHPNPVVRAWPGLGLAIQAYQRRALMAIDLCVEAAERYQRCIPIRLVKGAYWDSEIARSQHLALPTYAVFTTKAATDVNYLACAKKLLAARPRIYPMLATHNAMTLAYVLAIGRDHTATPNDPYDFEIQRLYGMGEALIQEVRKQPTFAQLPCRIYAPVGQHQDALAYLVRRLLENGANTSFMNAMYRSELHADHLLSDPVQICQDRLFAPNAAIAQPNALHPDRKPSWGLDLQHRDGQQWALRALQQAIPSVPDDTMATNLRLAGQITEQYFVHHWRNSEVQQRSQLLRAWADLLEHNADQAFNLLIHEAKKTAGDAVAEIREAIDFLRHYADESERLMGKAIALPSPAGEQNQLRLRGRGVWAAISPWNFPLAIFVGQIAALLATGNTVIAKPAPQTPTLAGWAISLAYRAGVPREALRLMLGDAKLGAELVSDPHVVGVVFTGSTQTARAIAQTLAQRPGTLTTFVAETAGVNAMIVDDTALIEQVVDSVMDSAFKSAGQRCSALRVLFLQEDIADEVIKQLCDALACRRIGPPDDLSTDIGPVIDLAASQRLHQDVEALLHDGQLRYQAELTSTDPCFFPPTIIEKPFPGALQHEVFGPVLQVVRYPGQDFDRVLTAIQQSGWGLTLGLQSRIDGRIDEVMKLSVGNIYVNRSMTGAVVGMQPFGGEGLSGTGPKAGGPYSLMRFVTEQTWTINTAAAGGNVDLFKTP